MEAIYFEERWTYITEKSSPLIKDYAYKVSDEGRVYSCISDKLLSPGLAGTGYYTVALACKDKTPRTFNVHRLVLAEFYYIPGCEKLQVNHFDGIKTNNNIWNLEWVTPRENMKHAYRMGLSTVTIYRGEDNPTAKISNNEADYIGYLLSLNQYTHPQISEMTGISLHIIRDISRHRTWHNVYDKYKLGEKKIPPILDLSDTQWELICKFWEDNKGKYTSLPQLFSNTLKFLFNIEYNHHMYTTMYNVYSRNKRTNISYKYNF